MQLEKLLLFLFCLCLTGIMVTQVVLRYFFGAPLFWAEEVSVQFLIFMTVFGVSYLTKLHQHISIDFILEQLNAKGDRKSTRLNSSHVAISYAVFCLKKK